MILHKTVKTCQSLNAHNRKDILGPLEQGLNKGGFHNISPIFQMEGVPLSPDAFFGLSVVFRLIREYFSHMKTKICSINSDLCFAP